MLELQGLPSDQKEGVEFTAWSIGIDDILLHLNNLEEIICDEDLESHLLTKAMKEGLCPKLKLINGVSINIAFEARNN